MPHQVAEDQAQAVCAGLGIKNGLFVQNNAVRQRPEQFVGMTFCRESPTPVEVFP
jgi:hypothetical protein